MFVQPLFIIHPFVHPYVLSHYWPPSQFSTSRRTKWSPVGSAQIVGLRESVSRIRQGFGLLSRMKKLSTDWVERGRLRCSPGLTEGGPTAGLPSLALLEWGVALWGRALLLLPASCLPLTKEWGGGSVGWGTGCMCCGGVWGVEKRAGQVLTTTSYSYKDCSELDLLQTATKTQKEKRNQHLKLEQQNQSCTGCPQSPPQLTSP